MPETLRKTVYSLGMVAVLFCCIYMCAAVFDRMHLIGERCLHGRALQNIIVCIIEIF